MPREPEAIDLSELIHSPRIVKVGQQLPVLVPMFTPDCKHHVLQCAPSLPGEFDQAQQAEAHAVSMDAQCQEGWAFRPWSTQSTHRSMSRHHNHGTVALTQLHTADFAVIHNHHYSYHVGITRRASCNNY